MRRTRLIAMAVLALAAGCERNVLQLSNVQPVAAVFTGEWRGSANEQVYVARDGTEEFALVCPPGEGLIVRAAANVPAGRAALIDVAADTGTRFAVSGTGTGGASGVVGRTLLPEVFQQDFANATRLRVSVAGGPPLVVPLTPATRAILTDC